jgi:hypothetical protein
MPRSFLTPAEHSAALAAAKLPAAGQRAFAKRIDPDVFSAHQGWVWGRQTFDLQIGTIDPTPSMLSICSTLEAIEYIARKRDDDKIARRATYRHESDRPYALVARAPEHASPSDAPVRSAKRLGPPTFRGPSMFVLGELVALEGRDHRGNLVYWPAPSGCLLVGCPTTHDMHVIRQGVARQQTPPVFILRNGSPYRLTDRGIVR